MKSAEEFYRDSTRIYDLVKEYHELMEKLTETEDQQILMLAPDDPILKDGNKQLGSWLRGRLTELEPELVERAKELSAQMDAMRAEQQAVIAAGWASEFEFKQKMVSVTGVQ